MRDILNMRFGRLMVLRQVKVPGARNAMWECQCDCGSKTVAAAANIGRTTFSCGCLKRETAADLLRGNTTNRTHNMTGTPEYRCWQLMKRRCYNRNDSKYPIYGGRGIVVCEKWRNSFPAFLSDMGPKSSPDHSINRKDNDGDYTPENCHWATRVEQARNTSRNVYIKLGGQTMCVTEWCEFLGVTRTRVYSMYGTHKGRKLPFDSIEAVIRHLYREKHS